MNRALRLLIVLSLLCAAPRILTAQERGATALGEAVAGLDVTVRVLMIGAHPDDEDTNLITWLARGRQVETGYLSLTRGDGGQNLIGNELGPLLGMIRTEELLAARRLDGGRQFFTRAYDFGFSRTAEETYTHWPKDSILRDVVTVVRAFRPQVIVAVFSGTARDGHGHHQVSAILAREAYDAAADTARFPARVTLGLGAWLPSKFYRASRFAPTEATISFNVGELSALRGQSYAEIASQSRSQHLSQGFGVLQRRGTVMDHLRLEASRVSAPLSPESSPLQDLDGGWSRFAAANVRPLVRAALDSLPAAIADVRRVERLTAPAEMVTPLARVARLVTTARDGLPCPRGVIGCPGLLGDLALSLQTAESRAQAALIAASGVLVEATAPRELLAVGDTLPVTISVYNQGNSEVVLEGASVWTTDDVGPRSERAPITVPPDSTGRITMSLVASSASVPWWLAMGRRGGVFVPPDSGTTAAANLALGEDQVADTHGRVWLRIAGAPVSVEAGPIINRVADPARGELRRPVAAVPAVSIWFASEVEYARSNVPFERTYTVQLRSATALSRTVAIGLTIPQELRADSLVKRVVLQPYGEATLTFRLRGSLPTGSHTINATATSGDQKFVVGYLPLQYPHLRPLRYYRAASVRIEAVRATLPRNTAIAYVPGVGDNVAPMLVQLGLKVSIIMPGDFGATDLSRYGAVVVGPRAFAASEALVKQAKRLQDFARAGGTVVVQYGQAEIQLPGILPFPVTLTRPAERVTDERAPVRILARTSTLFAVPNTLALADFDEWVQERALYLPTTADPRYRRVIEMHDLGEAPNENAVLVAPLGKGVYVYTTLALFRQLPAGVPGAARIFLNLIAANASVMASTLPRP